VRLTICGVRGSTPAPGADFLRYGGHTSCIAVAHDGERPTLILDSGTGIRQASRLFGGCPFEGSIVLSHLHWDHTQGLPFFTAGDDPDSRADLYIPAQGDSEAVLERFMSPPHFPIAPAQLRGDWRFLALEPGEHEIEGFSVLALEIPHKGGRTFGYRISDGRASFAYLSDHCPTVIGPGSDGLGERHEAALRLASDCDLLLHDAQYTDEELPARGSFGHASAGYAVGLTTVARAKRLLLFHHDPSRTDAEIDKIVEGYRDAPVPVDGAAQGMDLILP